MGKTKVVAKIQVKNSEEIRPSCEFAADQNDVMLISFKAEMICSETHLPMTFTDVFERGRVLV